MSHIENKTCTGKTKGFNKESIIRRLCIFSLGYIGCLLFGYVVIGMEYGFKRSFDDVFFTLAAIHLGPLDQLFPDLLIPPVLPVSVELWCLLLCIVLLGTAVLLILLLSYLLRSNVLINIVVLCFTVIWLVYGTFLFLANMGI